MTLVAINIFVICDRFEPFQVNKIVYHQENATYNRLRTEHLETWTLPTGVDLSKATSFAILDIKDKVASAMKSSGLSAVRLFTAIDQTDDGYVSRREIRTAVNTLLKDSVKVTDIDAMLETFDTNGDGVISLDEFLTVMEAHQPKQFVPVLPDLKPPPKGD